ncbi:hypothetical protein ACFYPC_09515 [Streptomyces sp. NPDC005808]|uniref:hypothetical protein n=1 Tax=Streptomyces sp. NPDC005808 TaxID=3364734 RepID=UPI0036A4BEB6
MSNTDSQPQLPADTSPPPDYAPDVHTRTRVLRRDWWRTPSDPPEHGRELPEPDTDGQDAAPEGEEAPEAPSRLGKLRDLVAKGVTAGSAADDEDRPADQDDAEDEEDGPQEEAEPPSRLARLRRALSKDDTDETAADEDAQADGEPDAEERERPTAPRTSPARNVPRPRQQPSREALFDWWARRDARQRFVLTNGAAAACGAYGPGLLSYRWDLGLPQLVLSWMHDAATSSTSSSTPLVLGGLAVVGAAVGGGMAAGIVLRFVQAVPTLCRITHWCLVRVPVASAVIAVCLYTS